MGWADLDPVAVGVIIAVTVLICLSTKESGRFNTVLVLIKLLGVVFVIVAGARQRAPEPYKTLGHQGTLCSS